MGLIQGSGPDPARPVHGGLNGTELRALGLRAAEVLDFSASINPLGVSPAVTEALRHLDLAAYPDPECGELRDVLADHVALEPERILVGNGATELIHLLARALLRSGESAAVFSPTFGEFEAACRLQGVAPVHLAPAEQRTFRWDLPVAVRRIAALRPALLFLCNPNNPTGTYLGADDLEAIAAALGDAGLLVLDEAYAPFVERRWDTTRLLRLGNVVLLRSMTKDHALTGLRLGYLLGPRAVVRQVRRWQPSWSVNAAAQAAGIAALSRPRTRRTRPPGGTVGPPLPDAGAREPGTARYRCHRQLPAGAGRRRRGAAVAAAAGTPPVRARLRLVRAARHVRIGVRRMADCRRLVGALRQVLGNGDG